MPLITLSVPPRKLPMLHDILNSIGIKTSDTKKLSSSKTAFKDRMAKRITNSGLNNFFSWEYFSNELEFE